MDEMDEKEIIQIISKTTEPLFKEQFINGALAGWNACIASILSETKDVHNCKQLKRIIKSKSKMIK